MEGVSLEELRARLNAAQSLDVEHRFHERNAVELIAALQQRGRAPILASHRQRRAKKGVAVLALAISSPLLTGHGCALPPAPLLSIVLVVQLLHLP